MAWEILTIVLSEKKLAKNCPVNFSLNFRKNMYINEKILAREKIY